MFKQALTPRSRHLVRQPGWRWIVAVLIGCVFGPEFRAMADSVDPSFNCVLGGDGGEVYAVAVQPDGCTLIGGRFASVAGIRRLGVARLTPDGAVDPFFNGGGIDGNVNALVLQPDGKVIIAPTACPILPSMPERPATRSSAF